jgi:hypothetical protein
MRLQKQQKQQATKDDMYTPKYSTVNLYWHSRTAAVT